MCATHTCYLGVGWALVVSTVILVKKTSVGGRARRAVAAGCRRHWLPSVPTPDTQPTRALPTFRHGLSCYGLFERRVWRLADRDKRWDCPSV